MAPFSNQCGGGRDDLMQPANGFGDPEDEIGFSDVLPDALIIPPANILWGPQDDIGFSDVPTDNLMMQPANGFWGPQDDIGVSNFLTNSLTMQASSGMFELSRIVSSNSGDLVPSMAAFCVPRGGVALEQIQEMFINPFQEQNIDNDPQHLPSSTANPHTEDQQTSDSTIQDEDTQEDEPACITHPKPSHLPTRSRKDSGPSLAEWAAKKCEIEYWYMKRNYTCEETRDEMAKKHFYATMPMYKRKFIKWQWKKYRKSRRTPDSSPGTIQDVNPNSNCSPGSTVAVFTSPRVNARIPRGMGQTEIFGLCDAMLFNTKELYLSYFSRKKWKVAHEREVEEDIHDDLLVGVGTSLRNFDSSEPSGLKLAWKGMQQAFQVLEKVVGVKRGADCGLFSLPAIWESFLRMIRKQQPGLAARFLSQALQLAELKFGEDHPFVQVLYNLQCIQKNHPQHLADVIFTVYRSCINHVGNHLGSFHLTTLSLWGDFVVYLDGSSINETRDSVDNIRQGIQNSETENGPDHAYTLELLGLTLYVLQSDLTMAEEAEEVALDMLQRVERIRANAGGKLEGDLLITRKDLKHTLGTLRRNQKDYRKAIEYLEEFFNNEVMDKRDTLALEKLEGCYISLGELEKAEMVHKRRMETSHILLWQDEIKTPEDDKACRTEEEPAESANRGCIGGTAVDDFESPNEKEGQDEDNEEEEDDGADEVGGVEAEEQLLREQISELKQKLKALKKKRKERKKKGKSSA